MAPAFYFSQYHIFVASICSLEVDITSFYK